MSPWQNGAAQEAARLRAGRLGGAGSAGGPGGQAVLQRCLEALPALLSPTGVAFVLFFLPELPGLEGTGLSSEVVAQHRDASNIFYVLRISRNGSTSSPEPN